VRVAAVQVVSENGRIRQNLDNAAPWVERAAARGAHLVLCPEFLAAGYVYEESIWDSAEPRGGPTERWLSGLARRCSIALGASFLEAEGAEFFNTFSLFGPDGSVLGRVRKASLPFFEGWFFRPCTKPKVIQTPFGKVGIGICNDNQTAWFLRHMFDEQPDLLLMPHSAPTPDLPILGPAFSRPYEHQLRMLPIRYSKALGVPVVMANKVSERMTETRIPLVAGWKVSWSFRGFSAICDADGRVLADAVGREALLIADVTLDPERKRANAPETRGYFAFGPPLMSGASGALLRALAELGERAYGRNPRRPAAARQRAVSE